MRILYYYNLQIILKNYYLKNTEDEIYLNCKYYTYFIGTSHISHYNNQILIHSLFYRKDSTECIDLTNDDSDVKNKKADEESSITNKSNYPLMIPNSKH